MDVVKKFELYETKDGKPTCRLSDVQQCPFLSFYRFGTKPLCNYANRYIYLSNYDNNPIEYIEPTARCFLRSKENE